MTFEDMLKTAKEILKSMTDAQMIANKNFDRYMANFLITDGEKSISADIFDNYFIINDGDRQITSDMPCTIGAQRKVYNLGLRFAQNNAYSVGLNA